MSAPPSTDLADAPVVRAPIYAALLKVLIGFVPGFLAVDLWVGWLDRVETRGGGTSDYYLKDEQLGWVSRPHFENPEFETHLDRYGLRSPEIPGGAPATEVRILGVGASRLYGAGGGLQSEIWNTQLARDLAASEYAGRVRLLNGGVMGYSTVQSCRRAIRLLPELQPDLVFVMVSPGAQLMLDPSAARHWVRVGDELVRGDVLAGWPALLHPLVAGAHRLLLHSNLYTRQRSKFQLDNTERNEDIQRWVLTRREPSAAVAQMLDRTFGEMVALRDAAAAQGCLVRILGIPEHYQDTPERWRGFCTDNQVRGAPPPGTPRSEPTDVLAERCEAAGLEYWSFDREVEQFGSDRERYMAADNRHWSAAGHRVFADGLMERLRAGGLLDRLLADRAANPR